MNIASVCFALAIAVAVVVAVAAMVAPSGQRPLVAGLGTASAGTLAVVAGGAAMAGQSFVATTSGVLPLSRLMWQLDPLGGFFVAVTGAVAVAVGVFAVGYTGHTLNSRPPQAMLPIFIAAMLLVPVASNVYALLVSWELMALTSLALVLAEHKERDEVSSAARWYAVMTNLGFVLIMVGLLIFASKTADGSFAQLRALGPHLSPTLAATVFILTLAGFGSKAGLVPLHVWLPRAHPQAPSHVSACMSAAMVNLGVYGVVRVGIDLLGGGARWWWIAVIFLGSASAVYGILQAAVDTDVKRLLGYSTTENMGLVFIGVGAAGLFAEAGNSALAGLALAAALLHVANHAAFKTLLFLAAGSVVHQTGVRDLDDLGGLSSRMPMTTACFAVGALSASALPLGAAFVSEWLLLQALIHGLAVSGTATAIVMPVAVAAIALSAGLALATFIKAFGIGFLARPRSVSAANAKDPGASMRVGMGIAAVGCAVLALVPNLMLPAVGAATGFGDPSEARFSTVRLVGVAGALSPLLLTLALLVAAASAAVVVHVVAARRTAVRQARLWDCGAGPLTSRMEYTATSFAEPLQRVFDDVLRPETDIDVDHYDESQYLVKAVEFHRRTPDRIEFRLYGPVLAAARSWGIAARVLANGSIHRYLGYGFFTLCALLGMLVVRG